MKRLLLIVALLALAAGCDKSEDREAFIEISGHATYQLEFTAGAQSATVYYTLQMPQGEEYMASMVQVKVKSSVSWLTNFNTSTSGRLTFDVTANTGSESRTGDIELSADGMRPAVIQVTQNGRSDSGDDDDDDDDNKGGDDDNKEGQGDSEVSVYRTGWAELPYTYEKKLGSYTVSSKNSTLYYAHHLCPDVNNAQNDGKARNYTVCFSSEHHCPMWVAAPRHKKYESGQGRSEAYKADPAIPANIQYAKKSADSGCNNGHMLGSAERTVTSATNAQVFYFSNIAPQDMTTFNTGGGAWNNLEDWVDKQVCQDTTYVVIGAYFDKFEDKRGSATANPKKISFGGREDVSWPTMFYYILLRTKSGSSGKSVMDCSESELKCAAFVRSHNCPKGADVSSKDMMSVADLEDLTGFTFFANVPNAPKDSCNPSDWGL